MKEGPTGILDEDTLQNVKRIFQQYIKNEDEMGGSLEQNAYCFKKSALELKQRYNNYILVPTNLAYDDQIFRTINYGKTPLTNEQIIARLFNKESVLELIKENRIEFLAWQKNT